MSKNRSTDGLQNTVVVVKTDKTVERQSLSLVELKIYLISVITKMMKACDTAEEYGISKTTGNRYMKDILCTLKVSSLR